jgi:hypothetical protein
MKQSFINKIALCAKCNHAFIIDIEGDQETCDGCISKSELNQELLDEGVFLEIVHDCY